MTSEYKHFKNSELKGLQGSTASLLDVARAFYGKPVIVTSTRRTELSNAKAGGAPKSSHLTGHAADLRWPEKIEDVIALAFALGRAGFHRLGVKMNHHVHVDNDPSKRGAFWVE
jgi:uncharacterized protein YcbK (DUF882 family)